MIPSFNFVPFRKANTPVVGGQFSGREEHGPETRDTDAAKPGNTKITAIDAESRPIGVAQFRFGCGVGVASDSSFEVIPDAIPERRNHFLERRVRTRLS